MTMTCIESPAPNFSCARSADNVTASRPLPMLEHASDARTDSLPAANDALRQEVERLEKAESALRESNATLAGELAEVQRLQSIGGQLVQALDRDVLCEQLMAAAVALLDSDMGSVQLFCPERNELRLVARHGFPPVSAAFWEWAGIDAAGPCGALLQRSERVVVADIESCDFMTGTEMLEYLRLSDIRALQATPVVSSAGRFIGVISTHWRRPHRPAERALRQLDQLAGQAADLLERIEANEDLRARERRLAFLLELSDALRPLADPVEIQAAACRLLRGHMRASRVFYCEHDEDAGCGIVYHDSVRDGEPSLVGPCRFDDLAAVLTMLRAGRPLAVADIRHSTLMTDDERARFAPAHLRALLAVPLVRDHKLIAVLSVHHSAPHQWTPLEISLAEEVAERTCASIRRAQAKHSLASFNERLEELVLQRTAALVISEERFRALVSASAQIVWTANADGKIIEDSPSWRDYTGQTLEEWLGGGWIDAVHPDDRARVAENWRRSLATRVPIDDELRLRHARSGSWRWTAARAVPLRNPDGTVRGWVGMNTDIEERRRAEEQLRRMASELTMVEQEERRRISQILHDDLQQQLYMIRLQMAQLVHDAESGEAERLAGGTQELYDRVGEAITVTRRLAVDLSPPLVEGEGLAEALGWLARQIERMYGLAVEIDAPRARPIPDANKRVLLCQIARELLFNMVKHAGVDRARIELGDEDGMLVMRAIDAGRGFDVAQALQGAERGFGLLSIRDRLALFGGTIEIDSRPDDGTRVLIRLPMTPAMQETNPDPTGPQQ